MAKIYSKGALFLKWAWKEPWQVDQKTRKLITIHKALHQRDDTDRLYISRKGGKGLTSIEAFIQELEDNIKKSKERWITADSNTNSKIRTNEEKQVYGCFKWQTCKITQEKTGTCLQNGNPKRETESLLIAAQINAIRINCIKVKSYNIQQNNECSFWEEKME